MAEGKDEITINDVISKKKEVSRKTYWFTFKGI